MIKTPILSVVLPVYNRAYLLPRAIRSVLAQSVEALQLVIIDDGSTDDAAQVVEAISDARIDYVRFAENRGIGAARHAGVCHAHGEFLAFIDSDDVWLPGKLETQLRFFHAYSYLDLIFGNFENINYIDGTRAVGFEQTQRALDLVTSKELEAGFREITAGFTEAILEANFILPSTLMMRTEDAIRFGNFDQTLSGPEDFEFWWRLAAHGTRFAYIEQPLVERHKDEQSITAQTIRFAPRYLRALDMCEQTSRQFGQNKTLPALRRAKHRLWKGLVQAYALRGERGKALQCYVHSLRYGVSGQAFIYMAAALAGPTAIDLGKRIRESAKGTLNS
jgi:glycosyltransferase involved in cell wall biosynthesis